MQEITLNDLLTVNDKALGAISRYAGDRRVGREGTDLLLLERVNERGRALRFDEVAEPRRRFVQLADVRVLLHVEVRRNRLSR